MGWEKTTNQKKSTAQTALFIDLNENEQKLVDLLQNNANQSLDELSLNSFLPMSKTASTLLNLEFKNVVRSLPGKMFQLV